MPVNASFSHCVVPTFFPPLKQKEVMLLEFLAAGNCMQNTVELSSEISKAGKK